MVIRDRKREVGMNNIVIDKEIVKETIEHYGKEMQSIVVMEECSELVQAVSKELRNKSDKDHLTEEMADVYICLELLKQIYGITNSNIQNWIDVKQKRAVERIESEG